MVVAAPPSAEKLPLAEIQRRYPDEWVVLVDYDFPNMELTAGVVLAHAPDRDALRGVIRSVRDRAVIWTGAIKSPVLWLLENVGRPV